MKKQFAYIVVPVALVVLAGCGTGLTRAAKEGNINALQKLLDEGANINESAMAATMAGPPLSHAAYYCRVEAVKYLINKGADVNATGTGGGGWRPLHLAAKAGCTEAIRLLLDAGADLNLRANDNSGSALAVAAGTGNIKTVKYLLEKGADIDDALMVLKRVGVKEGLALLQKYEEPKITAKLQEKAPALTVIKSDVDELPSIKAKPNKNAYAIVIGIESYRQKLPKADFADADAKTMSAYLTRVLGYPEENVVTLLNEHATNVDLVKYFEKWLANNVGKDSTVFIYYSGHGAPDPKTGSAYLVPYDGDPTFIAETGYSLKRMYDALAKLPAREIIVALDSCFSGAGGRSVIAKGSRPLVMNLQASIASARNMTVLAASSGEQISSTYDEKGHGLFTYFLLKGIKNEEVVQADGSLEVRDLYNYIKPQVESIARKKYNNEQTPQLIEGK